MMMKEWADYFQAMFGVTAFRAEGMAHHLWWDHMSPLWTLHRDLRESYEKQCVDYKEKIEEEKINYFRSVSNKSPLMEEEPTRAFSKETDRDFLKKRWPEATPEQITHYIKTYEKMSEQFKDNSEKIPTKDEFFDAGSDVGHYEFGPVDDNRGEESQDIPDMGFELDSAIKGTDSAKQMLETPLKRVPVSSIAGLPLVDVNNKRLIHKNLLSDFSLSTITKAARTIAGLPVSWFGEKFEAVEGQGILVTGYKVEKFITRGKRKGEPNWRSKNKNTKHVVFVPNNYDGM